MLLKNEHSVTEKLEEMNVPTIFSTIFIDIYLWYTLYEWMVKWNREANIGCCLKINCK